ncbi:sulfur carrier protein ThiS [Actibacterium sp. MT2.3-13A]|uniref:sulfur carrier protein ThiS n=1 Tax=Actibacterium sp. MT2.3-13A TaxID=2828332 RepID=UPI001BA662E2|nr:sulfur carrier protein ThiS [Actibacterium sp. MT2.3-13A]
MIITVNGETVAVTAGRLSEILEELGYGGEKVATAVNETFVPAAARAELALAPGDRLEIVAPRQGG